IKERFVEGIMILKDKEILLIFLVNLALTFAWLGYMSFFPTYLIEGKMFSQMETSIALAVLATAGIFLKPLIGEISDRYNKKMILSILILLSALATFLLVYTYSIVVVLAMSFILAFTSASFPIISSYLTGRWEEKGRGGKLGFYRTMVILTGSPTSAIIGISASKYGFDAPFLAIALILFVTSFVIFSSFIKEKC
ncbi:MAG TPA: MFS transporter, partial [Thermoplasmatales archaeon]|nr:MFS transporter [Thermoplasmatales archaeon]